MVGEVAKENDATGFAERLKALRAAAQLTQQQLADKLGVPVQNINRLESGRRTPSWATVIKLAEALDCSTDDFLPEDE